MNLSELTDNLLFCNQEEASKLVETYNKENGSQYSIIVHSSGNAELKWPYLDGSGRFGVLTFQGVSV